jgi:hypothetical protein
MAREPWFSPPDAAGMAAAERAIRRAGLVAFLAFLVAAGGAFAVLPHYFDFPEATADRLAFAAKAAALVMAWVVFGIGLVSTTQRCSPADIAGSAAGPPSPRLAVRAAFLQNTLEQAAVAAILYLALAALLPGRFLSVLVPAVCFFAVGRVLFLRGYTRGVAGRALGMTLTMTPTILGYVALAVLVPLRVIFG